MNRRHHAIAAALLTFVFGVVGHAAAQLEVRVTAPDPGGEAGDVEDASLTGALAQALIDAGLPALRARDGGAPCRDGCLRVHVRRLAAQRFLVEVRASARSSARAQLQLGAAAAAFDVAHALAIEVEALVERTRAQRARAARPAALITASDATPATPPVTSDAPPSAVVSADGESPQPLGALRRDRRQASDDSTLTSLSVAETPAQVAPPSAPSAPVDDARVALDVAAMMLASPGDDHLFMLGSTVGARVRIAPGGELRAGIAFLRPERRWLAGTSYRRELLPLQLALSGQVPQLPALRLGVGVEGILVGVDESGHERPSSWSLGALGRTEYRYAIRSFALLAAAQAALHPASWHTGPRDPQPLAGMPSLTVSLALGLQFTIF